MFIICVFKPLVVWVGTLKLVHEYFVFNFRFKTNDTDLLDECSFVDPRVKSLAYLSSVKRSHVKDRVLACLKTEEDDIQTVDQQNETCNMDCDNSSTSPDLLSSLLSDDYTCASNPVDKSCAEIEIEKYLAMPPCAMKDNPLSW